MWFVQYLKYNKAMKLSDYIAKTLLNEGVHSVFGYPGSSISHVIDSICNVGIKYVQVYHEQAASFAACGYAGITNNLGVAIACSGPGATNLITGIANAYYDSLPCLFIVGQVSSCEMKANACRQNGFQETRIVDIVKPITKYAVEILDKSEVEKELKKCIIESQIGRKGPTLISIPHDIQQVNISVEVQKVASDCYKSTVDASIVARLLKTSKRPVVLMGGGAYSLKTNESFQQFIQKYKIPTVASLRGLNNVLFNEEYLGFLGVYGNRLANLAIYGSDLILVLGSRLDARQTGGIRENFAPNAKIIQVDVDCNEIGRDFPVDISFNCTCETFFESLSEHFSNAVNEYNDWHRKLTEIKEYCKEEVQINGVDPNLFVEYLSSILLEEQTIVTSDVGQNQMWVAQSLRLSSNSFFLTSGGHGTMGYSLPSAIGGFYGNKNATIVSYMGDGGLQMNMQELETMRRENIPAVVVVFRNNSLGLIRDYQNKALNARLNGSVIGFSNPDFSKLASLYDMDYLHINDNDFSSITYSTIQNKRILIDVEVSKESVIHPELAYKRAIFDQSPFINIETINTIINE